MSKLATIGERETTLAARSAVEADPRVAYRTLCPLCGITSGLYIFEPEATEAFDAHLATHSIQDALPLLMKTGWLSTFALIQDIAPPDGAKEN